MTKFHFTLIFIFLTTILSFGQNCDCVSNFEWVRKTFEENDAGFQYVIDKKGQAAYDIHNQLMIEKIRSVKTSTECTGLLDEWLRFFRKGHIGIERLTKETPESVLQTTKEIETWKGNIAQFEKYINTKKEVDYEGIWQTGNYKIGIQKEGKNYIGFIIETSAETWKPREVKLKIEQDGEKVKSTFYLYDHSPEESNEPEMLGNNYLQIGRMQLKRLLPVFPENPFVVNYIKSRDTQKPYLDILNETTLYLRIPYFFWSEKQAIDSVIAVNRDKILKTENLIIDLRNNGGGTDASYSELLPFLYTNPIRTISVEFLSTELNNQDFLGAATNTDFDEETQQWAKNIYDKLNARLGEFVNPFDEDISTDIQVTVYEYPKNVGIIIHERNASATEQFLLDAKQSKKVKLFGTTTFGALDISNMSSVESPCKEFNLSYGTSRSLRIPDMTIDDIGLQPDYYLDKTISQYKWVEFVNEILNGK